MAALSAAEVLVGILVVAIVFYDLFQSVVLPRPSIGRLRLAPRVFRPLWRLWRWAAGRTSHIEKREQRLAVFAPLSQLVLLAFWSGLLILGFGLILDGFRDQLRPPSENFGSSLYVSATTLLPLSYGDVLPVGVPARLAIIAESASGVGLIALVITLLFSLYASFQSREELVVTLDAMAGAPPSGIQLLETAAQHGMKAELTRTFDEWRHWSAAVLESHLAYPALLFFRSSHDNEAWLNSFGAVMDAAVLIISTIDDESEGPAHLMYKVGHHLVEDITWYFHLVAADDPLIERSEYEQGRERLQRAGYRCRNESDAWEQFARLRSGYASIINQVAQLLAIVPAQWISDRSYLPHRQRRRR